MADKDDPFGLSNDAGRTRIRPLRDRTGAPAGGRDATPPPTAQSSGYGAGTGGHGSAFGVAQGSRVAAGTGGYVPESVPTGGPRVRHARAHPNPLIACFSALLELAPELERAAPPAQPEALRVRLYDNLVDARDAAVGTGVPLTRANQAAWFVAALLDDIALNTPWGGHSSWPRQPIVTQLSGEVDAGTRYFDRMEELIRFPNRDPQLLELAHVCLGLGFRGKYRVQPGGGEGALLTLRTQAARLLQDRDTDTAPLSPHYQGVTAPDGPRRMVVPVWTIGLVALAIMTGIYMLLSLQLGNKSDQLFALAGLVPPKSRAEIYRPVRETVAPAPEIVIKPVTIELLPAFTAKAPPDTAAALTGRENPSLTILNLQGKNPEVFRSAKSDLNDVYQPLVAAIAGVIVANKDVIGAITVVGHTDNVPVQKSNPFATNQGLSEARAATIAKLLIAAGVPAEIVKSEGRADTEPVGDNATKDGRAQNRRVEIKIEKRL